MSISSGYKIATSDIILYLDAGNRESYPGSGSIWYDISGNKHHAYGDPAAQGAGYDDARFPIYQSTNGGRFYFDGNDGLTILTDMGAHAAITADFWCYRNSDTSSRYFFDGRNDGGPYWLSNYSSYNININNAIRVNNPVTYQYNSNWWDKWSHIVITADGSQRQIWVDGENTTLASSSAIVETLGQYFRIGNRYTSSGRWSGYFSTIKFYSRVLTDSEIISNYNALKNRFL